MNEKIQELKQMLALKEHRPGVMLILEQVAEICEMFEKRLKSLEGEEID